MIESVIVPELEIAAGRYRPRNRGWSKEEERVLVTYYGRVHIDDLCRYLARSNRSVQGKVTAMGLSTSRPLEAAGSGGES